MTLIEKLQKSGVKVYSSSPLWEKNGKPLSEISISDDCVVVDGKFGKTLVIQEKENVVYVPLKSGTSPEKEKYTLQEFVATRDSTDYNIHAGTVKVFAI